MPAAGEGDGLIIYGTSLGTDAYAVDTAEIYRRAGQITAAAQRLSFALAALAIAEATLRPSAHLALGGWAVLDGIAAASSRIGTLREAAETLADRARVAATRYEAAEAGAWARIPGRGVSGQGGRILPLDWGVGAFILGRPRLDRIARLVPGLAAGPLHGLRRLRRSVDSPEADHSWLAQALRLVPGSMRIDPELLLPLPGLPLPRLVIQPLLGLGAAMGFQEGAALAHGQLHPGGAGAGKIVRELTGSAFPLAPDPAERAARILALVAGGSTAVRLREVPAPGHPATAGGAPKGIGGEPVHTVTGAVEAIYPLYPDHGGVPGEVRVDKLTAPDGSVAWEVFIPGSQGWDATNPFSWRSNPGAMIGMDGASTQTVLAALRAVGAGPTEPVLLTGHSQGGMVAVNVANHPRTMSEFDVQGIITVGSPISGLAPPVEAQTLALEHMEDPVPGLDDASNAVVPGLVTVERPLHESVNPADMAITDATGSHDVPAYARTAERVDRSGAPELAGIKGVLEEIAPDGVVVESRYFQAKKR